MIISAEKRIGLGGVYVTVYGHDINVYDEADIGEAMREAVKHLGVAASYGVRSVSRRWRFVGDELEPITVLVITASR